MGEVQHIDINLHYELGEVIGRGSFGHVRSAVDRNTGEKCAVKTLDKSNSLNGQRRYSLGQGKWGLAYEQEYELLKRCNLQQHYEPSRHNLDSTDAYSHVLRAIAAYDSDPRSDAGSFHIVTEYLEGGELYEHLFDVYTRSDDGSMMGEAAALGYARQMLQAVEACHYAGFAHLDVKAENFMFERRLEDGAPDTRSRLVLCDFGSSEAFGVAPYAVNQEQYVVGGDDTLQLHRIAGTARYVAPEVIGGHFSSRSDVWSVGAVLYLMLLGETPFAGLTMTEKSARSDATDTPGAVLSYDQWQWNQPKSTPGVKALVQRLLAPQAQDRLSATEAINVIDKLTQANRVCVVGAPNHLVGTALNSSLVDAV